MLPLLLGVPAGLLTTVAGAGGGLLLLMALSLIWDPLTALAVTAPAQLVGNAHRLWLFRSVARFDVAGAIVLGALPGSLVGGLLAVALPAGLLHGLMAGVCGVAIAKRVGWFSWRPTARWMLPLGFMVGGLTATSGGAGLLVAPILLSAGLSGPAYVATGAACAVAMHSGRLLAYGIGGQVDARVWLLAAILALWLTLGNWLGARLRPYVAAAWVPRLELSALVGAVAMVSLGLAH